MKQCEYCGANLVNEASFCGKCGRLLSQISHHATGISDLSTIGMVATPNADDDRTTILSASGKHAVLHPITLIPGDAPVLGDDSQTVISASGKHEAMRTPSGMLRPVTLIPIPEDDEDDERTAMLAMGLLPLGEIISSPTLSQTPVIQGTPPLSQAPVIQNTPQITHVPTVAGTPPLQGGQSFGSGSAAGPGYSPSLPHTQPPQPLPPPSSSVKPAQPPTNAPGKGQSQPPSHSPGCLPLVAIFVTAIIIILITSVSLGLTIFAPGLSLTGNAVVTPGGDLLLHGRNFLPNSSVTLRLDGNTPVYFLQHQSPVQQARQTSQTMASTGLVLYSLPELTAKNVISTRGDGTFSVTIQVSPTWLPGHHTVQASEETSHRSASLPFTIALKSVTNVPTATPTTGTTPTPSPTPSPTPTAPAIPTQVPPPTLSCASPANLSLGLISELSSQGASAVVTLCTAGSGTLNWRASWNQNQAPWLKISHTSGFIQAPNQVQTTLSASAAKLTAGIYHTAVTFVGLESNTAQIVNVTLTVKAGCVSATPQALRFTGVEGISDPTTSQTISVTNCNLTSNWSASLANGSNWLSLSANRGTLAGGATTTVAVTASNLNAGLRAGTYQDTIVFSLGSDTASVGVTLVVQTAPITISASPTIVDSASSPSCSNDDSGNSDCTITLANNSSSAALIWSDSSGGSGVSVQAGSTTIPAGSSEPVTIVIAASNCGTPITVTFTAPDNAVNVTWNCTPSAPIR